MECCIANLHSAENDAQVYELVKKERETRPAEQSLAEYYTELRLIWKEIDYYEDFKQTVYRMPEIQALRLITKRIFLDWTQSGIRSSETSDSQKRTVSYTDASICIHSG